MPKERIDSVVEGLGTPLAERLGYELVEVEYHKEGPDWVLRCTIDKESGITTDDCQRFSEALGQVLDQEDPIPGSYLLEVSSPGLERPLKHERDFQRFSGQRVELKLFHPLESKKVFTGVLSGIVTKDSEKYVAIKIDERQTMEIPRENIVKARLVPELFGNEGGRKKQ